MRADWLKIVFVELDGHRTSTCCWRSDGASKENLHFHNQSCQVVFVFVVAVFPKRNRKAWCTPCFYRVIETLVKVWENSRKLWKHSRGARVPTAFFVLPNFHSCFYVTSRFHVAVHLSSNRSQMTSKCGKNKKVAQVTTFWCPVWSITGNMHGNMEHICFIWYRIKLCTHKRCFISRKVRESGAFPILINTNNTIWCHLWSIQNETIPLVAMRWQRIMIGLGKSRHCQTWLEYLLSWNENLQRKQSWAAKS